MMVMWSLWVVLKKSCSHSIVGIEVTEHCPSLIYFILLFEISFTYDRYIAQKIRETTTRTRQCQSQPARPGW